VQSEERVLDNGAFEVRRWILDPRGLGRSSDGDDKGYCNQGSE
jgi:hypothetical protein